MARIWPPAFISVSFTGATPVTDESLVVYDGITGLSVKDASGITAPGVGVLSGIITLNVADTGTLSWSSGAFTIRGTAGGALVLASDAGADTDGVTLTTGLATGGTSGPVTLSSGVNTSALAADGTGDVAISTGASVVTAVVAAGDSGDITLATGVSGTTTAGATAGDSGDITLDTGASTAGVGATSGSTGGIYLTTGDSDDVDSGPIELTVGLAPSGARGNIVLDAPTTRVTGVANIEGLSATINSNAAQGVNEDPSLVLLGGDGGTDLFKSTLSQDSSGDTVSFVQQKNTAGAGYVDTNNTWAFGDAGSQLATVTALQFYAGTGGGPAFAGFTFTGATDIFLFTGASGGWQFGEAILPATPAAVTVGSAASPFSSLFAGNAVDQSFQLSGLGATANRVISFPDATTTMVGTDTTQTLTAKTLTTPIIAGLLNAALEINSDAAAGTEEDPSLTLSGGDGGTDLVKTTWWQDSSADVSYVYATKNGTPLTTNILYLGHPTDTSSGLSYIAFKVGNGVGGYAVGSINVSGASGKMFFSSMSGYGFSANVQPQAAAGAALGLVTLPWSSVIVGNAANKSFQLSGLGATADRVVSFPDATTTMVGTNTAQTLTAKTFDDPVRLKSYTVGTLPAATAGHVAFASNETGGATMVYADGTNWRRVYDNAIAS